VQDRKWAKWRGRYVYRRAWHGMAWHGGNGVTEAIRPAFQRPGLQLQMAVVWEGA
jgi:hypothetical protein